MRCPNCGTVRIAYTRGNLIRVRARGPFENPVVYCTECSEFTGTWGCSPRDDNLERSDRFDLRRVDL